MTDIIQAGIEIDVTGVDKGEVALKRLAQAGDQVDKSFERGAKAAKGAGDATAQAGREADKARGSFSGFTQETKEMAAATNSLTSAVGKLGSIAAGAFAGIKLTGLIKDVTMANSRFEQMGLVMDVVGRNAGMSQSQIAAYAKDVQAMGISMMESRQTVIRMTQAQMDLSKASELARLAQDAAVIANTNSSDALGRMIYGLQSGQVEILRNMGLNVNFAKSYGELAKQLGIATDQLSEQERVQARTNAVMEAGAQIAGVYDASMENAGKQLGSTTRHVQDLQIALGSVWQSEFSGGVSAYSGALKILGDNADTVAQALKTGVYAAAVIATTAISKKTAATMASITASRAQAAEELRLANAHVATTAHTLAHAAANNGLIGSTGRLTAATAAYEAALKRQAAAQAASAGIGRTLLGVIGGPAGLAVTAGAVALSFVDWGYSAEEAAIKSIALREETNLLTRAVKELDAAQARQVLQKMEEPYKAAKDEARVYAAQIEYLTMQLNRHPGSAKVDEWNRSLVEARGNLSTVNQSIAEQEEKMRRLNERINENTQAREENNSALVETDDAGKKWLASLQQRADFSGKLTEVQRVSIAIEKGYAGTLSDTDRAMALANAAIIDRNNAIKSSVKPINELSKALKELEREQKKHTTAAVKAADALEKGNDELIIEIANIGKTKRELVAMEQQRNRVSIAALKEAAAVLDVSIAQDKELGTTKDLIALKEKERDAILDQIDLINERNDLLGKKIDTEEVYESQKKIAEQWKSLSDDMGKTFTDAIIQGGASAKDAIKRMFANMVLRPIVEPIAQGVANMFTGAISGMFGGGQGGGLLSGLFGGGESGKGGSSFGLGDIASMGKNVYSAFTGWGKAIYTGFAEGGFTGAMKGFGSYLSNGFSTMTAKLGSMFGGGTATAGAASGGASAGAGGAAMSNPVGWAVAALLGSMNFYKAGYTLDHKQVANQKLSKIHFAMDPALASVFDSMMKATQFASKNLLEPLFGKKWGNILSLGPLFSGVSNTVNKALFGGKWKTKDVGIGLGFDGGEFTGQQFEYRKKKGGLFSSSKKKTIWTAMDEEIHDALSEAMAESVSGTKGLFEALGFEIADDALSGLKTGIKQISTMGKDEEKIQEEIGDWLASTNEAVASELHKVLGTGLDLDLEGLTDFVLNLMGVNEILGVLGLNAYESSIAGAELAETLSALAGGLENLASASDVYYKNFFTAEEQFEHSFAAMTKALEGAELGAIGSREAYRKVVEGLDLTTEAGQEMFATMMLMAGTASEYFSILEAQAAEIAAYNSQLDVMKEALSAESVLAYAIALDALQTDFDVMSAELEAVGLATDENIATLEQFRQKMAEMAALDLFDGGQSMADALRQGLMGTWDGEAIGSYLARSISDGVYGAIAGQFANQITDILLQGIVAPMINAALTGAAISEAVTKESIAAIVAQAQAVAQVASEVMGALKESGVMDELQKALGGGFTLPKANYTMPAYRPPVVQPVDDSWKRLLESIVKQTERAQQQIADMGRTTYEKGLAAIASTVADYQSQIAQSTASKRKQLTAELAAMEQAERRLLEAQMDQRASDMLAGLADELERMGKTDAELAIMSIEKQTRDYINSLHDVGRATAGNIAQVEAWSQAMKDAAARDAQIKAASGAFDALGRAVESQRSVITEALELARDVAQSAAGAAKDLFAGVLGASDASAAQARAFISDALSTARSTGYLPDGDKLREAIDSATRGLDDAAAVSIADANWQKLVLANQLKELADLAEPQVDYAQSQLDALDNMLQNAQDQLNVLQGIDNSVLTVAEALNKFNEAVGNGQIITPDSPVFTPEMPPQPAAPDNRAQAANAELVAEVIELRNYMREIQRETKRTADAVNGRGDAPMLVETV